MPFAKEEHLSKHEEERRDGNVRCWKPLSLNREITKDEHVAADCLFARSMREIAIPTNYWCEDVQVPQDAMDVQSLLFATRLACTKHADGTPCIVHAQSLIDSSEVDCVSIQSMGCCGPTFIRAAEGNMEDVIRSASMCGINLRNTCDNITLPALPQSAISQMPHHDGSPQTQTKHAMTFFIAVTTCLWIVCFG